MKPALIVIGLGNPGKEYEGTRHNAGFLAADLLAKAFGTAPWQPKQKFSADVCEGRIITVPVLFVKPTTYMNRSGESARKIIDFYQLNPAKELLVICDDIDLQIGTVRFRENGSSGTHNGLQSVAQQFGEEYPRIRIGVGAQAAGQDLANYVLSNPDAQERKAIDAAIAKIPEMVRSFVLGDQKPSKS